MPDITYPEPPHTATVVREVAETAPVSEVRGEQLQFVNGNAVVGQQAHRRWPRW